MAAACAYPKSSRLLNSSDYSRVFKHAELNISHGPLRLRAIKNRMPRARLGVVVSKKGNAKAVRRNRIKRLIRERYRLQQGLPCVDIALQVFAPIDDKALNAAVDDLLGKVKKRFSEHE